MPVTIGERLVTSRRDLLKLAGAAILGGCAPRCGSSGDSGPWYALLSDPHIAADPLATLRGETMAANLRAAVNHILDAASPPRGVIVNGDLAFERGLSDDYDTFLALCDPLRREGLPLHLIMGNHDDRENLRRAVDGPLLLPREPVRDKVVGTIPGPGSRFVMLDSQVGVNVTSGMLGDAQRRWLADDLDAHPQSPTILMVHHHLDATARPALRDTTDLVNLIRNRRQVKMVVYGHTHCWNLRRVDGVVWLNLPALGYGFPRKQPLGWVELRPHADGAEVVLWCVGGDRGDHGRTINLTWRNS